MGTRRLAAVVAVLAALLAGCAARSDDAPAPGGSLPTPSTPGDRSGGPTAGPPGSPGPGRPVPSRLPPIPATPVPPSPTGDLTLTGTVVEGVEANCLLLDSPAGSYLLLAQPGVDRSLFRVGARITVRGRVGADIMTTCQQGTPFMVVEVRPA
jgi:hypothetical protein